MYVLLSSISFIERIEEIRPINREPVSPMKIFAGCLLKHKKAANAPVNENAVMVRVMSR